METPDTKLSPAQIKLAHELIAVHRRQRRGSLLWLRALLLLATAAVVVSLLADGRSEPWEIAAVVVLLLIQPLALLNAMATLELQHRSALDLLSRSLGPESS